MPSENRGRIQNLNPWQPGQSGNPGGRPKGLAAHVRAVAPPDKLAKFYMAVFLAGSDETLLDDELRAILGPDCKVTLGDRLKAGEWLSDHGYGKAPSHAPVEGENPLELDGVDRTIGAVVDELAALREAETARRTKAGEVAATG